MIEVVSLVWLSSASTFNFHLQILEMGLETEVTYSLVSSDAVRRVDVLCLWTLKKGFASKKTPCRSLDLSFVRTRHQEIPDEGREKNMPNVVKVQGAVLSLLLIPHPDTNQRVTS